MHGLWNSLRNRLLWSLPLVLAASNYSALSLVAQGVDPVAEETADSEETPTPGFPATPLGGGGGMGGMGGGMGGMGGPMRGMGRGGMGSMMIDPPPVVTWVKPPGEKPDWLIRGEKTMRAQEEIRAKLNTSTEYKFDAVSLAEVCAAIAAEQGILVSIDTAGLDDLQMTADLPITFSGNGQLRSLLTRMLDPLELDYLVHEDGLEITTPDEAIRRGPVRAYNLAYVASDSSVGERILLAIEQMVQPEQWVSYGGLAACDLIGPILLVKASEGMHVEVQSVLAQLNALRANDQE